MIIAKTVSELRATLDELNERQKVIIGLVPTMGALHQGHMALVQQAKKECGFVVCSIFVNPIQFNNSEDFVKYPIRLNQDIELLEKNDCDLLFCPSSSEMYPEVPSIKINFGDLENVLEGAHRPGHFSGVGLVVSKLFHFVKPHYSYFGEKDLQQCAVIKKLVRELSFDVNIVTIPTIREPNGLAMSSRNVRLSEEGKTKAASLYASMELAKSVFNKSKSILESKKAAETFLKSVDGIELEYFEFVDKRTFEILEQNPTTEMHVCIACYVEGVRLIDNLSIN